jgi:hypothetical protein
MVNFTVWLLFSHDKNPQYLLNRRLSESQSLCDHFGGHKTQKIRTACTNTEQIKFGECLLPLAPHPPQKKIKIHRTMILSHIGVELSLPVRAEHIIIIIFIICNWVFTQWQ